MKLPRHGDDKFSHHQDVIPSLRFTAESSRIQYKILTHIEKAEVANLAAIKSNKRLLAIKFEIRRITMPYTSGFNWLGRVAPGAAQDIHGLLPEIKDADDSSWIVILGEDEHWFKLLRDMAAAFAEHGTGYSIKHYTKGGIVE